MLVICSAWVNLLPMTEAFRVRKEHQHACLIHLYWPSLFLFVEKTGVSTELISVWIWVKRVIVGFRHELVEICCMFISFLRICWHVLHKMHDMSVILRMVLCAVSDNFLQTFSVLPVDS